MLDRPAALRLSSFELLIFKFLHFSSSLAISNDNFARYLRSSQCVASKIIVRSQPGGLTEVDREYCLRRMGTRSGAHLSHTFGIGAIIVIPRHNIFPMLRRACVRAPANASGLWTQVNGQLDPAEGNEQHERPLCRASMILSSRVSNRKSAQDPVPAIFPTRLKPCTPVSLWEMQHLVVQSPRLFPNVEGYFRRAR